MRYVAPQHGRRRRGSLLLEVVVAMSLLAVVIGTGLAFYASTTRKFSEESGLAYVQSNLRITLDRMADDLRTAQTICSSATVNSTLYATNDGTSGAMCLILRLPSQDSGGLIYYGTGASASVPATDTIVYRVNAGDHTLRRSTAPSVNITGLDGKVHSSFRPVENDAILAYNVTGVTLVFHDQTGAVCSAGFLAASADINASYSVAGGLLTQNAASVTGIRLRNMRSGGITGSITPKLMNAKVESLYNSNDSLYNVGASVNYGMTDSNGNFTVPGLDNGSYQLKVTTSNGTVTMAPSTYTISDGQQTSAGTVSVNTP